MLASELPRTSVCQEDARAKLVAHLHGSSLHLMTKADALELAAAQDVVEEPWSALEEEAWLAGDAAAEVPEPHAKKQKAPPQHSQ